MRVLSLFDGISCGRVALDRAEIPVDEYYAYEIEQTAIQISEKNYPDIIHCGDVTKADFKQYEGIDLLIGGSPCQGFSFAGKQLNFDDSRSKLFFDFVRALKDTKPKWFLLENVKMKQEFSDVITDMLGVKPIEINSSLVSAQNRKRIYWTNIPNVIAPEDKHIMLQDILEYGTAERDKSKTLRVGGRFSGWGDSHEWDMPNRDRYYTMTEMERLQTLPDGYTAGVPDKYRSKALGNCWTVDVIAHIFKGLKSQN